MQAMALAVPMCNAMPVHGPDLVFFLLYVWSREYPQQNVNIMGVVNLEVSILQDLGENEQCFKSVGSCRQVGACCSARIGKGWGGCCNHAHILLSQQSIDPSVGRCWPVGASWSGKTEEDGDERCCRCLAHILPKERVAVWQV